MARILVLGDSFKQAEEVAAFLNLSGHYCNLAVSLPEAVGLLRKEAYDIVVSDCAPSDSNSAEALGTLKAISPGLVSMVICQNAGAPHGVGEALMLPGPTDYFARRTQDLLEKSTRPSSTLAKFLSFPPKLSAAAPESRQNTTA